MATPSAAYAKRERWRRLSECVRLAAVILEAGVRLSQSVLWKLQREYFAREGIDAWSSATVPHYITCNAFIAEAYARVVLGWMRDIAPTLTDRNEPIYLVELGSGSGRFGFLFLKKLEALLAESPLAGLRFVYVLTDFTDDQVAFWQSHGALQPYVERGVLDFARYDAERDDTLHLASGRHLERTVHPMAVLANYFFDSIPQDVFVVQDGKLFECLATVSVPEQNADLDDPTLLDRVELSYDDLLVEGPYYGDAELDRILHGYQQLVTTGGVRLPVTGLHCCQNFAKLSGDRWLLLTGDKGNVHPDTLDGLSRPPLTLHGSFSMNVNYHAIGELFAGRGGRHFSMDHHHSSLNVVAFTVGTPYAEAQSAFAASIENFGPDEYFIMRTALERDFERMKLKEALALLRLGRHDPRLLLKLLPVLRRHDGEDATKRELLRVAARAWDLYYFIGEKSDLPFSVGVFVFELAGYELAIELFLASIELYGVDAGTAYNLALAHYRQLRPEQGLYFAKQALEVEENHAGARKLHDEIVAELAAKEV